MPRANQKHKSCKSSSRSEEKSRKKNKRRFEKSSFKNKKPIWKASLLKFKRRSLNGTVKTRQSKHPSGSLENVKRKMKSIIGSKRWTKWSRMIEKNGKNKIKSIKRSVKKRQNSKERSEKNKKNRRSIWRRRFKKTKRSFKVFKRLKINMIKRSFSLRGLNKMSDMSLNKSENRSSKNRRSKKSINSLNHWRIHSAESLKTKIRSSWKRMYSALIFRKSCIKPIFGSWRSAMDNMSWSCFLRSINVRKAV